VTTALLALVLGAILVAVPGALALRRARARAAEAGARAAQAAEAAEAAERRRREVLQDLPFVAMRLDAAGRLVEANLLAIERFPFLVPGMSALEAFSEHRLASEIEGALADLGPRRFEARLFVDGRRTHRVSVEPYEIEGVREALMFLTDTSEAADYQELRSQFVANVSHELRTPLTGLRALLEALDDPQMDAETRRDFTARASSETQRLEALITDVLFLSELEATHGVPSPARSDLAQAAVATGEELEELAAEHRVTLRVEVDGPVWAPLTERMARTVVRNLVENAVKYAGHGATATTTVRAEGDSAVLVVSDDGAGIPEQHLPHVFERFYRADPSRSKRLGGTGLGLSIVRHIAERFAGGASATSREGFGTTITVTLPRVAEGTTDGEATPPTPADAPLAGP
jgi:two-component system phosphate regulon sensor histidine kinase PhoR